MSFLLFLKYIFDFGPKFETKRLEQHSSFEEAWFKLCRFLEIRFYNNILLWFSKSHWIKQEAPNIFNSTDSKIWYLFIIFLTNKRHKSERNRLYSLKNDFRKFSLYWLHFILVPLSYPSACNAYFIKSKFVEKRLQHRCFFVWIFLRTKILRTAFLLNTPVGCLFVSRQIFHSFPLRKRYLERLHNNKLVKMN